MSKVSSKDFTDSQLKKKKRGLCITSFCRKKAVEQRNYCHCCRKRKFAEMNPLKYSYMNLRQRARARGKEFTITYQYYENLAIKSGYDKGKGIFADSLTLDRLDNDLGYIPGNIGVKTRRANSMKRHYSDYKKGKGKNPFLPQYDYSEVPFCIAFFLLLFAGP
jgi:hypothetical protein